jgi:hypothetical protein
LTAPRTNVSYADTDLFLSVGYNLGLAHPPGYPLYSLLLFLMMHAPLPLNLVMRANMLSIIAHAVTLGLIFEICKLLLTGWWNGQEKSKQLINILSLLATTLLANSFLFWLYGTISDKYALNDLLVSVIVYLMVKILTIKKNNTYRYWLWLAGLLPIAIMHHHTDLVLIPAVLWLIYKRQEIFKKSIQKTLLVLAASLIISVGLLWSINSRDAKVSWHFPNSLDGLIGEITRRESFGYIFESGKELNLYRTQLTPIGIFTRLMQIIEIDSLELGIFPLIMAAFGIIYLIKKRNDSSILILLLVVFSAIFLPMYLEWPDDLVGKAIDVRQYLLGFTLVSLGGVGGLGWLWEEFGRFLELRKGLLKLGLGIISIGLIMNGLLTFRQANLNQFDVIGNHFKNILTEIPTNSVLACMSDTACFALIYDQKVLNLRPDVLVVPHAYSLVENDLENHPDSHGFEYTKKPELVVDYLTWNWGKRRVFVIDFPKSYYDYLGMNYGFIYYQPYGYYGELVKDLPARPIVYDSKLTTWLINTPFPKQDLMRNQFKVDIADKHISNATLEIKYGWSKDSAVKEAAWANELYNQVPFTNQGRVRNLVQTLPTLTNGFVQYVKDISNEDAKNILHQAQLYFNNGEPDLGLTGVRGYLARDPLNESARVMLAQMTEKYLGTERGQMEWRNVLKYFPSNHTALEAIKR